MKKTNDPIPRMQTYGSYGRMDRLYHRGLRKPAFSGLNNVHSARHAGFYIEFSEWTICTSLSLKNTEETRVRHQHCLSVSINSKRSWPAFLGHVIFCDLSLPLILAYLKIKTDLTNPLILAYLKIKTYLNNPRKVSQTLLTVKSLIIKGNNNYRLTERIKILSTFWGPNHVHNFW